MMHSRAPSRDLTINTRPTQHRKQSSERISPPLPQSFNFQPAAFNASRRSSNAASPESYTGVERHARSRASSVSKPYHTLHRTVSTDSMGAWSVAEESLEWGASSSSSINSVDWPPEVSMPPEFLSHNLPTAFGSDGSDIYGMRRGSTNSISCGLENMGLFDADQMAAEEKSVAQAEAKLAGIAETIKHASSTTASDKARGQFVLQWLNANYVSCEDGNVSRQALFGSFTRVCDFYSVRGVNAASFGKAVRSAFPGMKTRRLGARQNSKYHYCLLRPRTAREARVIAGLTAAGEQTEPVRDESHDAAADELLVPANEGSPAASRTINDDSLHLPAEYPIMSEIVLKAVELDVQATFEFWQAFSVMCSAMLTHAAADEFEKIAPGIKTFFFDLNAAEHKIVEHPFLSDQVFHALSVIYDSILSILIKNLFGPLQPQRLGQLRHMALNIESGVAEGMATFVNAFNAPQIEMAARFGHLLQRQIGLSQIVQALTGVLAEETTQADLRQAWMSTDFDAIRNHAALCTNYEPTTVTKYLDEFQLILTQPGGLQTHTMSQWLERLVEKIFTDGSPANFSNQSRTILVRASYIISQFMRDLTLRSDKAFGAFQLVALFCQDWLAFSILRKVTLHSNIVSATVNANAAMNMDHLTQPPNTYPLTMDQQPSFSVDSPPDSVPSQVSVLEQEAHLLQTTNDLGMQFSPRTQAIYQEMTADRTHMTQYASYGSDLLMGETTAALRSSLALTPIASSWPANDRSLPSMRPMTTMDQDWNSTFIPRTPLSAGFFLNMQMDKN